MARYFSLYAGNDDTVVSEEEYEMTWEVYLVELRFWGSIKTCSGYSVKIFKKTLPPRAVRRQFLR